MHSWKCIFLVTLLQNVVKLVSQKECHKRSEQSGLLPCHKCMLLPELNNVLINPSLVCWSGFIFVAAKTQRWKGQHTQKWRSALPSCVTISVAGCVTAQRNWASRGTTNTLLSIQSQGSIIASVLEFSWNKLKYCVWFLANATTFSASISCEE